MIWFTAWTYTVLLATTSLNVSPLTLDNIRPSAQKTEFHSQPFILTTLYSGNTSLCSARPLGTPAYLPAGFEAEVPFQEAGQRDIPSLLGVYYTTDATPGVEWFSNICPCCVTKEIKSFTAIEEVVYLTTTILGDETLIIINIKDENDSRNDRPMPRSVYERFVVIEELSPDILKGNPAPVQVRSPSEATPDLEKYADSKTTDAEAEAPKTKRMDIIKLLTLLGGVISLIMMLFYLSWCDNTEANAHLLKQASRLKQVEKKLSKLQKKRNSLQVMVDEAQDQASAATARVELAAADSAAQTTSIERLTENVRESYGRHVEDSNEDSDMEDLCCERALTEAHDVKMTLKRILEIQAGVEATTKAIKAMKAGESEQNEQLEQNEQPEQNDQPEQAYKHSDSEYSEDSGEESVLVDRIK